MWRGNSITGDDRLQALTNSTNSTPKSSDCENIFRIFISSCFVGLRKPERDIYRTAVEITQIAAEQCCFIDDRALNLECAAQLGMKTIQMESPDQLRRELEKLRVIP